MKRRGSRVASSRIGSGTEQQAHGWGVTHARCKVQGREARNVGFVGVDGIVQQVRNSSKFAPSHGIVEQRRPKPGADRRRGREAPPTHPVSRLEAFVSGGVSGGRLVLLTQDRRVAGSRVGPAPRAAPAVGCPQRRIVERAGACLSASQRARPRTLRWGRVVSTLPCSHAQRCRREAEHRLKRPHSLGCCSSPVGPQVAPEAPRQGAGSARERKACLAGPRRAGGSLARGILSAFSLARCKSERWFAGWGGGPRARPRNCPNLGWPPRGRL